METPAEAVGGQGASRAGQIDMEEFIERATRAVLRAAAGLNPQPLPPHPETVPVQAAAAPLNPQPLPPGDIIVGIIFRPRDIGEIAAKPGEVEV